MKYEALYAAVVGAAPTVLIGYVLEHRLQMKGWDGMGMGNRWFVPLTIVSTFLAAVFALALLATSPSGGNVALVGDNPALAFIVGLMFGSGIAGLAAKLLFSVISPDSEENRYK